MPRSGLKALRYRLLGALSASMRPGQSCPGVVSSDTETTIGSDGFNEAGAIMPRSGVADARNPAGDNRLLQ